MLSIGRLYLPCQYLNLNLNHANSSKKEDLLLFAVSKFVAIRRISHREEVMQACLSRWQREAFSTAPDSIAVQTRLKTSKPPTSVSILLCAAKTFLHRFQIETANHSLYSIVTATRLAIAGNLLAGL